MLQRSGFQPSITSEIAPELNPTLARTVQNGWQRLALPLVWLPETWPQYLVLLAVVLGLAAGLAVQVYQTVEIAEAHVELRVLQAEYERIERHNADLIFVIATRTALNRIHAEAQQQGFVPATGRAYLRRDLLVPTWLSAAHDAVPAPGAAPGSASRTASSARFSNTERNDQAELTSPWAAGDAAGWQIQLMALMQATGESVDQWRRSVVSSMQATAGPWLDRIMGW